MADGTRWICPLARSPATLMTRRADGGTGANTGRTCCVRSLVRQPARLLVLEVGTAGMIPAAGTFWVRPLVLTHAQRARDPACTGSGGRTSSAGGAFCCTWARLGAQPNTRAARAQGGRGANGGGGG
jgi:hypothetical protein